MTIRVRLLYDKQKKTKYINYIYGEYFEEGVREASTNLKRGTEAATAKHFKRCTGELKVAIGWVRPTDRAALAPNKALWFLSFHHQQFNYQLRTRIYIYLIIKRLA